MKFWCREVVFLIPARITRPFFSQLYAECETRIFEHFNEQIRPVIRAVSNRQSQFCADEITRTLDRELRLSQSIAALVVVPTDSPELSLAVSRVSQSKGIPVIGLTLPFLEWPTDSTKRHPSGHKLRPPYVICNSPVGTRKLAEVAAEEFRARNTTGRKAHVVVIPGARKRIDSRARISSFTETLIDRKAIASREDVSSTNPGRWQRIPAQDEMRKLIENAPADKRPIDIVFAANDEMALGARDAVLASLRSKSRNRYAEKCLIYGFDAIPEARSLIRSNDYHLRGTVEQQIPRMADKLVRVLDAVMSNKEVPERYYEVEPVCILSPEASGFDIVSAYPNVPPLDCNSGWVRAGEASRIAEVKPDSLKTARARGEHRGEGQDKIGRDGAGRIWRLDEFGRVWYHRGSLYAAKARRRRSR